MVERKMKLILENWNKFINEESSTLKDAAGEEYIIISRPDGKLVLISPEVMEHISLHGKPGSGSIFSGTITPDMIMDFIEHRANIADTGGFVPGDFPGGGYELVKPMSWVKQNLPNAVYTTTNKEEFSQEQGKMVPVPVLMVKTAEPIESFATNETSVGIFKYDPARSSPEQNNLIDSTEELATAAGAGRLFALGTAFPGGFEIEGQPVPRVTEWGGTDPETAQWAVIMPQGA
jgi:hypothetical protein